MVTRKLHTMLEPFIRNIPIVHESFATIKINSCRNEQVLENKVDEKKSSH